MQFKKPKILIWDLEFKGTENWKKELKIFPGYLLCYAGKELGKPGVKILTRRQFRSKDILDDYQLVKAIGNELRDVDMHILQYGSKIDFKFMQTKLMYYNLPPLPEPPVMVDTCIVARQRLALVSNSMRTQAEFFKFPEEKMKITHEQWYKAFALDTPTMKIVEARCASDVRITEQLYLKLRHLMVNHPMIRTEGCAVCGGFSFKSEGTRATAKRMYRRLYCKNCGNPSFELIPRMKK